MCAVRDPIGLEYFYNNQNLLLDVLEHAFEGIVVVDREGKILFMNQTYQDFLSVHDVIGRPVTEIIENTRMHVVVKTGIAELSAIQHIKGNDMIAHRIPIFHQGNLIAAVGTVVFQDVRELKALNATVEFLRQEIHYYKKELQNRISAVYGFDHIIGDSLKLNAVKSFARKVAKSDTTILITGESGTGKELFAHAIHAESHRTLGPLVRVNCAAIPETLLESELFGYDDGAFTGASRKGKKGKFELANHGTILLDEIGDMPLSLQAKLLRVLQEKEIERVGGSHPIPIDVRFLSSTNKNLIDLVQKGQFREDLLYRINVVTIQVPPLRDRIEDLPSLVQSILRQLTESMGVRVNRIDGHAWDKLKNHRWPGNIRELRNVLERAIHLMDEDVLKSAHIVLPQMDLDEPLFPVTLKEAVQIAEKATIQNTLTHTQGDKVAAAKILGISKSSLYQKIAEYQINL